METSVMVAIASVPIVGSGIQVGFSEYLQRAKEIRWIEFWEGVEKQLNELSDQKLDADYLKTEDFVNRVCAIHTQIISTEDTTKFEYLRNYLLNCLWDDAPDVSWKDLFFRYITNLSGTHLRCLSHFYKTQGGLSETDRFHLPQRTDSVPLTCAHLLKAFPSSYEQKLIEAIISDLESYGLLRIWRGDTVNLAGWSITGTGIQFIKFVT